MFHYVDDKAFLRKMRAASGKIMQDLCHTLKEDFDIGATFYLIGSGARNLILQNGSRPVDLDYNLEIVRCENINDGCYLKESVRKSFNKALRKRNRGDCGDSTTPLTSPRMSLNNETQTLFSIDVCITTRDNGVYYRLIHKKTGFISNDEYYWNIAPNPSKIKDKSDFIKAKGNWALVRQQYLSIKNTYLQRNDTNHPSFVCYVEAVNNVYNSRKNWK